MKISRYLPVKISLLYNFFRNNKQTNKQTKNDIVDLPQDVYLLKFEFNLI